MQVRDGDRDVGPGEFLIVPMRGRVTDQRGIALPLAMFALLIFSVVIIAFLQLSTSEPVIANNQSRKGLTLVQRDLEQIRRARPPHRGDSVRGASNIFPDRLTSCHGGRFLCGHFTLQPRQPIT